MSALRALLLRRPGLALCVVLFALALKLVVPAGFMLGGPDSRVLTIRVCEESAGTQALRQIVVPMSGEHGALPSDKQTKAACPFASHNAAAVGGTDLLLLVLALAFVLARGFAPVHVPATHAAPYLRPPLRAPPFPV